MAFGFLIVYIAALLVRPQEWYEPLRGYEVINVVAIVTILATFLTKQQRDEDSLIPVLSRNSYARMMWGLFAAAILSELSKLHIRYALAVFTDFGKIVVLFFLVMVLADHPRRTRAIMWTIVISAGLLCIHALMQWRLGYGFGNITPFGSWEDGSFRVRGTGMFHDPNDFAMLFIMAVPFVLTLMRTQRAFVAKSFLVCLLGVILFVLYLTKSRGGMVGFCAMLVAYGWLVSKTTIPRLIVVAAMLAAVVYFRPERGGQEGIYEGAAAGRIVAWGVGNEYLKQNPVFGIGFGQWLARERIAAHSSYVNCYAELGLFGYVFWLGLCWLVLRSLRRITRLGGYVDPGIIGLARGLFAALVGYLTAAFFLTRTYNHVLYFLLGMGIGLIRYIQRQNQLPRALLDLGLRDLRQAAIIAVASIPGIWILIKLYWAGAGG